MKVFLSSSYDDRSWVGLIEIELKKLGVSVFNPDVTLRWRAAVTEAIRKSDAVIVFWTPNSKFSEWVNYELGSASALAKDIVVVKPSYLSVIDLPVHLAGWHVVDFDPATPKKTAESLVYGLVAA